MSPTQRTEAFNQSGVLHAELDNEGRLSVYGDYAPDATTHSSSWAALFRGGRFRQIKLEIAVLTDEYLVPLREAQEVLHLNVKGNSFVTGEALAKLPATIGLLTLDVAGTAIGDGSIDEVLKFPTLETVWGHKGQFSQTSLARTKSVRPKLMFQLIY